MASIKVKPWTSFEMGTQTPIPYPGDGGFKVVKRNRCVSYRNIGFLLNAFPWMPLNVCR
ncbi:hypothetical protein [Variovorax paradoxus]|uniref:hypothetical protein n=1 Tax=Variovorax paradoxus TaxID=34073 RepID=UPI0039967226